MTRNLWQSRGRDNYFRTSDYVMWRLIRSSETCNCARTGKKYIERGNGHSFDVLD